MDIHKYKEEKHFIESTSQTIDELVERLRKLEKVKLPDMNLDEVFKRMEKEWNKQPKKTKKKFTETDI